MQWRLQYLSCLACLHYKSPIHDDDPVTQGCGCVQVMRDSKHGHIRTEGIDQRFIGDELLRLLVYFSAFCMVQLLATLVEFLHDRIAVKVQINVNVFPSASAPKHMLLTSSNASASASPAVLLNQ